MRYHLALMLAVLFATPVAAAGPLSDAADEAASLCDMNVLTPACDQATGRYGAATLRACSETPNNIPSGLVYRAVQTAAPGSAASTC